MIRLERVPDIFYFILFAALSVLFRFMSFHFSVADHDESTYLVVAQEILKGKTLYVDIWDTKPPGIFLIFSSFISIFGHSIVAVRLFSSLIIGFTAYFIFLASCRWRKDKAAALIGGLAYVFMSSAHKWSLSVNTELYFNLFTAIGLFIFTGKKSTMNYFLAGLVFGLGFIIKYFVLFDLLALWIFYLLTALKGGSGRAVVREARNTLVLGLGFLLPFLSVLFGYLLSGNLEEFAYVSFVVPLQYSDKFNIIRALNFVAEFHLVYAPVVIVVYMILMKGRDRQLALLGGIWLALVWIIVILPGKFFPHYYFQLLVPLSFLLTGIKNSGLRVERFLASHVKLALILIFAGFLAWNLGLQYRNFVRKPDVVREAAHYLEHIIDQDDVIYCDATTMIYFLLDKSPPGRYVHTTLLSDPRHIDAIGVDVNEEYRKIFGKDPDYVITRDKPPPRLKEYIDRHYRLIATIRDEVMIYERKPDLTVVSWGSIY